DAITHEIAHAWFGDSVTMTWWDDVWLNEALASWMEAKIVGEWQPGAQVDLARTRSRGWAMHSDSLVSARQIRQPIATRDDIEGAFDGITYAKGQAVLEMFEHDVGDTAFQAGIRAYVHARVDGNATVDDFLGAIGAAAGRDIAPAFHSFLDQPGLPL